MNSDLMKKLVCAAPSLQELLQLLNDNNGVIEWKDKTAEIAFKNYASTIAKTITDEDTIEEIIWFQQDESCALKTGFNGEVSDLFLMLQEHFQGLQYQKAWYHGLADSFGTYYFFACLDQS